MGIRLVQQDILRQLSFDIFAATGIPEDDARIVSDHLLNSLLAGHDSHGVWFVPGYARAMKKAYVTWDERQVVRENASLVIIDGKGANGIVAVTRALDLAVEKARNSTFGFVGLRNVSHIGRLGDYPPRIARDGMIGMVWLNVAASSWPRTDLPTAVCGRSPSPSRRPDAKAPLSCWT